MLVPMRMALEGLDPAEAVDAVLRQNIHGLELDQRCVAIAAFAMALEAWRYPDAGGFRALPKLKLAWCGQPVAGKREQWLALAEGDSRLEAGMAALYDTFRDAPTLGGLIDPARSVPEDMLTAGFGDLQPLLEEALREHAGEEEWEETAIAAHGLAEATSLLSSHYHLVITNVPYLARGKQNERLRKFAETRYPSAKNDLANVFLERCLEFSKNEGAGVTQIVMPQNWLFLTSYKAQREHLLKDVRWDLLARLGPGAFETISGEVVNAILLTLNRTQPHADHQLQGIDVSGPRTVGDKANDLRTSGLATVRQRSQSENPDSRVAFGVQEVGTHLSEVAECYQGIVTGDIERFTRKFWEVVPKNSVWVPFRRSNNSESLFGDVSEVLLWENGEGTLHAYAVEARDQLHDMHESGNRAWGRHGVAINRMRGLRAVPYYGEHFDNNVAVVFPKTSDTLIPVLFAFLHDEKFHRTVRDLDQAIKVTNQTLLKVPFDVQRWSKLAASQLPDGLPLPYADDCTQWAFHGHLRSATSGLQVVGAHLLGFRWPAERDPQMELDAEARRWVAKAKALHLFEDEDGIVCIPSVRGERPAAERLLQLLHAAYGDDWHDGILAKLLAEPGSASLDDWLRNIFFERAMQAVPLPSLYLAHLGRPQA